MLLRIATLVVAATLAGSSVGAQTVVTPSDDGRDEAVLIADVPEPAARAMDAVQPATPQPDSRRACDGCPVRSVGKALWHTTVVNMGYEAANLIRGQVTARITPESWWDNMHHGWVWDLDEFQVNQFGHPYQGNNYFNAGRANGLGFYESAAVAAFGSATWEYFGETNLPSLNDLLNTTLGGAALGEMFHRTAWLVRNPRATGRGRLWNEIGATALDPVTGLNRFISGDAKRITDKPADMIPSATLAYGSVGMLWRGTQESRFETADPFLEVNMLYGDPETGRSRTPYDAFVLKLRLGGGSGLSETTVRGRLMGQPFRNGRLQFSVLQDYQFESNDAYATGGQSFEAALGMSHDVTSRTRLWMLGWGGLTVLGAVDSLPLGTTEKPPEEESEAGQGVSEGPRYYDYGPGSLFGATAYLSRDGQPFVMLFYEGRHLYSLDGVRANHLLQRARLDLQMPVYQALGLGVSAEYFDRHTFFQDAAKTRQTYHYPQLRAYMTWRLQ